MEGLELHNMWKAYDRKLEESRILNLQSWVLNISCYATLQNQKAKSKLTKLLLYKAGVVILGIGWILFLGVLVYHINFRSLYFSISACMIMLITLTAIIFYSKHIVMITQIDYEGNIADTQERMSKLQTSILTVERITWLQLPFYTTFLWSNQLIMNTGTEFWLVHFPVTLLFGCLAIILYRNITPANLHKKWVRKLFLSGPEYNSILSARSFLDEIEEFKKDIR